MSENDINEKDTVEAEVDQEIKQKTMTKKDPLIVGTIEAIKEIQKNINSYAYYNEEYYLFS